MSRLFQVLFFSIVFLFFSCSGAKYSENHAKKPAPLPRTNPSSNEQIYDTPIKHICNFIHRNVFKNQNLNQV